MISLRTRISLAVGGAILFTAMVGGTGECKAPTPRKPAVFIACETYSIRNVMSKEPEEGKYDLISVMPLMKELGMKGVTLNDIWLKSATDKAYLDKIKKAARDNGLIIAGLICEGNLSNTNDEAWNKQIEINAEKMRAAAYLGAPLVRLNLGGLGDQAKDDTIGTDRCIAAFNKLLPLAKELKVKMTIENHGGPSRKADNIIRIIEETDPKWVGSCLDFKNWPQDLILQENAKLARYAYHTHAKAHTFGEDGEETVVPYGKVLQMLKDAKYKGAVSIEFEGPGDQIEGVKKTRDLVLRYWKI